LFNDGLSRFLTL